ncbi:MAG TPA: hypothetical protein VFE32_02285 [Puia sp.]|nr:hypothetical protein [Puia sp.]
MLSPNRRLIALILAQLLLCWLETFLISRISWIGKVGIALFYQQYAPLRSFWKTYLIFSIPQMTLILTLYVMGKRSAKKMTNLVSTILLVTGLLGLVLFFQDFLHTYGHRLLKERFHLGFYIFWISWTGTCLFFLFSNRTKPFPLDPNAPNVTTASHLTTASRLPDAPRVPQQLVTQPSHPEPQPASYTPAVTQQPSPPDPLS